MVSSWDQRYREGFYNGTIEPHDLVVKFSPLLPAGKPVIDIAMGSGRDLLFLGHKGFHGIGLERSSEAIKLAKTSGNQEGVKISPVFGDAHALPFKSGMAGAVLVFYFLLRDIMADLVRLLAPGGIILYETYLKRQNDMDDKPRELSTQGEGTSASTSKDQDKWAPSPHHRNPLHLLNDGELIRYFADLDTIYYEEGVIEQREKRRALARYVGRKK